jgi:hypothetical protein
MRQISELRAELSDKDNEINKLKTKLQSGDNEMLEMQRRYFDLLRSNFSSPSVSNAQELLMVDLFVVVCCFCCLFVAQEYELGDWFQRQGVCCLGQEGEQH